ncbi:MAG: DUF2975 domain-containing protein [Parvularculaceae bacterium]
MKAIGKGSLASILAAGLHIVRVVLFIAFFGLCIAAVALPLAPLIVEAIEQVKGAPLGHDIDTDTDAGDYLKILGHFVTVGVMLYIVNRLLEILRTLRFGSPFVRENADRFKRVGYALLIGEGAKFAFSFLGMIFDVDLEINMELTTWIAIIAVFVLAEVFREGAKMKEEQDLTV